MGKGETSIFLRQVSNLRRAGGQGKKTGKSTFLIGAGGGKDRTGGRVPRDW